MTRYIIQVQLEFSQYWKTVSKLNSTVSEVNMKILPSDAVKVRVVAENEVGIDESLRHDVVNLKQLVEVEPNESSCSDRDGNAKKKSENELIGKLVLKFSPYPRQYPLCQSLSKCVNSFLG